MPPEKYGSISKQDLNQLSAGMPRTPVDKQGLHSSLLKRLIVFGILLALSIYSINEMYHIFLVTSLTVLEWMVLLLFSINFCWIAMAFSNSCVGFFRRTREQDDDIKLQGRVAVVLPVYNESAERVFALVETMALELGATPKGQIFDWFILSDSTDPHLILSEEKAFWILRQATAGKVNVYYRRRVKNIGRKAGNIEEFCQRWGSAYASFIVLDADSMMEPRTLITLAERMQSDPDAGLIQTIPMLINGKTPFALVQQFASRLYGPLLGRGLAWWTQKEGIFWGHNAIIRTEAYMKAAGLPTLAGSPPFGGEILSHDFVEGALIRRAGWSVIIADDLDGSYEECPPSIYDMGVRDRRWCQGNLQHSKIIKTKGLHWVSRFHLMSGILSYLSSPFWLMLILFGLLLSLQSHYFRPEYFTNQFTLFPVWPKIDYQRALQLFIFTLGILFGPKIFGLARVIFNGTSCKAWGGCLRLTISFLTEVILSALIAPVMMLMQTGSILSIVLFKKDCRWIPQRRSNGALSIKELLHFHRWHMAWGIFLGYASSLYSWTLLGWMLPAIVGLCVSVPLSVVTASQKVGMWLKNLSLLSTPEEVQVPKIVLDVERKQKEYSSQLEQVWEIRSLLKNPRLLALHLEMIDQRLAHVPGSPIDPLDALVIVKVNEAQSLDEVLQLLSNAEIGYLLGNAELLKKLSKI